MSIKTLFNEPAFAEIFGKQIKDQMVLAAEPILQKAIEDVRVEMRKRLAEMVVGLVDQSYQVDRLGADIRIMVKLAK